MSENLSPAVTLSRG